MAEEQDSSQERSEEATPKRRSDAREKGDIARSKELNTAAILIGGAVGMILFGGVIAAGLARMMRYNLVLDRRDIFEVDFMAIHLSASMVESLVSLLPVFTVLILAAILGPLALGGCWQSCYAFPQDGIVTLTHKTWTYGFLCIECL